MMHDPFAAELLPHRALLSASARRLGVDPDDLVQETYLRALASRAQYRLGSNARGWLYRILVNAALTEHRRARRDRRLEARLSPPTGSQPMPGAPPPALPQLIDARRALAALSAQDQEVLQLADFEGRPYREVAALLSCPVGTVMSRLHRARRRLRERAEAAPPRRRGISAKALPAPAGRRPSAGAPRGRVRARRCARP
jgi:RNA polymerase sigma-70 factor (ECF subfamily)